MVQNLDYISLAKSRNYKSVFLFLCPLPIMVLMMIHSRSMSCDHASLDRIFIFVVVVVVYAEIYIAFNSKETSREYECLSKYPQDRLMNTVGCTDEIIYKRQSPAANEVCHRYGNIVAVMVCCGCSVHC